jgi:hypothetical protein
VTRPGSHRRRLSPELAVDRLLAETIAAASCELRGCTCEQTELGLTHGDGYARVEIRHDPDCPVIFRGSK